MIEQPLAANGGSKSVRKAEFWQIGQSDLNRPFSEILQWGRPRENGSKVGPTEGLKKELGANGLLCSLICA